MKNLLARRRPRLNLQTLEDRTVPTVNSQWAVQFDGAGNNAVTTDILGNVYVAGTTDGALPGQTNAGGYDAFVRKYDANGIEVWTRQFGGAGEERSFGIAMSGDGLSEYVVGGTNSEG